MAATPAPASRCGQIVLQARYNAWMNDKLYAAAAKLPRVELERDRKAFFGSLLGTLNHICVGDTVWLKRFAGHSARHAALEPLRGLVQPTALNQMLFTELGELVAYRRKLDEAISGWAAQLSDADLDEVLHYRSLQGAPVQQRFDILVLHFFNHQTHHRGQASTLLFQAGVDVGVTDLVAMAAGA